MDELMTAAGPYPTTTGSDLLKMFLSGRKPGTTEAYRQDLADLAAFLHIDQRGIPTRILAHGNGAANATVLSWRADMIERALSPATINRRLSAVRSMVTLARTLGMVPWSLDVKNVAGKAYRDTRGPDLLGVKGVLAAITSRGDNAQRRRNECLLRLMFDHALRRGEIVAMDVSDVDLPAGVIFVTGKGKSERSPITLSPTASAALKAWIAVRGETPGALFPSITKRGVLGERMSGRGVHFVVQCWGEAAGLSLHPHSLRHSSITAACEIENGNLARVAKHSRHADIRTVQVYNDNREDAAGQISKSVGDLI